MNPAIIKTFEKRYHAHVVQSYYDSNAQLFAKLSAGGASQYDIIVPSNYYVPRLIHAGLLQPLNHRLIPNLANLKPRFKNPPFDPHNRYTAAYQWGTTGIVYNTARIQGSPDSWSMLFRQGALNGQPFAMDNEPQVMLGAACAFQGNGYRCRSQKKLKHAARLIAQTSQRPNFSGFVAGTPALKQLARGNVAAVVAYNGDYVFDKSHNPKAYADTRFVVPRKGAELWVDNMAIPAHAPHPRLANKFINFVLRARIGAKLSNYNSYATPNAKSQPLLEPALKQPPVTPTPAQMRRLHYTPALKGSKLRLVNQLWTEIKAR